MKSPKRGLLRLFERAAVVEIARMSAHSVYMWAAAAAFTCAQTARLQSHEMLPWELQVTATKWTSSPQLASLHSLAVSHSSGDPSVCQLWSGRWHYYRDVDRHCSTNIRTPCLRLRVFITVVQLLLSSKRETGLAQSVQRLATGWTVRGSNPDGGRDFQHPSRPAVSPTQPPIQWVPGSFPGVKRPRRGVDHPPPSSAEVKERVDLYL
jgi:hypothetical protein